MGRWTDIAEWRGPTVNHGGAMIEQRGLVEHIAEGSYEGTISWCKNPSSGVSAHFVVARDGRIAQVLDTDVIAWTQRDGNGHWLSVENEGHTPGALTDEQLAANARIFAKTHSVYGVPLQLAVSPSGRGLGHHSMGAESGANWGHSECPGPAIKAQKPAILARAIAIIGGGGSTDMIFAILDGPRKGAAGRCGGGAYQFAVDGNQLERWRRDQGGVATTFITEKEFVDRVGVLDAAAALPAGGGITAEQARAIVDEELDEAFRAAIAAN